MKNPKYLEIQYHEIHKNLDTHEQGLFGAAATKKRVTVIVGLFS